MNSPGPLHTVHAMPPKKEKKPVRMATAYDPPGFAREKLPETLRSLKADLEKAQMDRNQIQVDRDTVQGFYDITREELREFDLSIAAKDREMELMEENHRVEVKVYEQKVKHLEYEHRNGMRHIEDRGTEALAAEEMAHMRREAELRRSKAELRALIRERESAHEAAIAELEKRHERALETKRKEFRRRVDSLREQYEERLARVRSELELRRKVEVHEVEERKNQHINDLMRNHEREFRKIKEWYNHITKINLQNIRELKAQIADLQEKQVASQALQVDISEENKRLADPLVVATEEVLALKADLHDVDKDRFALKNARARLKTLQAERAALIRRHRVLERSFTSLETEKDRLYDGFEETIRAVQRRAEFRNDALERRLDELQVQVRFHVMSL